MTDRNAQEWMPCPLCGTQMEETTVGSVRHPGDDCPLAQIVLFDVDDCRDAWNRRHGTDRIKALEDALQWYAEQARLARLINKEGDAARHAMARDGGSRARAALAASQPAQPVAVKPLEWGPYPNPVFAGPDISVANVSGAVISYYYQAGRDPDALGYYVFAAPTHGTLQWRSAGYASIEAAKAAAQADYEARIMAALDVQPLTVQDAARVPEIAALIEAAKKIHDSYWYSSDGIITGMYDLGEALRAIAEGRA